MKTMKNNIVVMKQLFSIKYWAAFVSVFVLSLFNSSAAFAGGGGCITIFGIPLCFGGGGPACALGGFAGLGDIICNLIAGTALLPTLLAAVSYLIGLFLVTMAVIKTKEHVEDPRQTTISEPVKRFVAGGAFLALPIMTTAVKNSLTGGAAAGGLGTTSGMVSGVPTAGGLDAMLFFLILDIFQPMMALISAFGYLAGIILVMIGISRLLKSAQDGPRGPGGIGTIFTFITAGLLFSIDTIMRAATGSLFGLTSVNSFSVLSTSTGDAAVDGHILSVISSVIGFMVLIGLIAFVRGIFILREVAEGSGQASLMAAMSHIIGGALAVNMGSVINAVQSTFGLSFVTFV